jgi:hypothetical protein
MDIVVVAVLPTLIMFCATARDHVDFCQLKTQKESI